MDRIYRYNPNAFYKPNEGRYLQLMSAKDLYIQSITVAEYHSHSKSFQVKFSNVFTNIGEIHYHKENKTNGGKQIEFSAESNQLKKKSKLGVNEMLSNC